MRRRKNRERGYFHLRPLLHDFFGHTEKDKNKPNILGKDSASGIEKSIASNAITYRAHPFHASFLNSAQVAFEGQNVREKTILV